MGGNRLIQINVNHTPFAHDLLQQVMAERGVDLAVVAEPHRVPPDHPRWMADKTRKAVALNWRHSDASLPCTPLEAGKGYAAARWGKWMVVGVYLTPRLRRAQYERGLARIAGCIRRHPRLPAIVAGDFNAHSTQWGSPATDPKGRAAEEWAASLGLVLVNRGSESTCVRPQGESVVDLTWADPRVAAKVTAWQVVTGVYSGSDHLYIQMDLECTPEQVRRRRQPRPPRWSLHALDEDMFEGALRAGIWPMDEDVGDPERGAARLRGLMTRACDCAAPRTVPRPRRGVYWWSDAIASLRREANAARRRLKRLRRGLRHRAGPVPAGIAAASVRFAMAKEELRREISAAKARAWQELLDSVGEDPWGRPYHMVMGKLKRAPPYTESLDPPLRDQILSSLFPDEGGELSPWQEPPLDEFGGWRDEWRVSVEELRDAVRRMRAKNKAPGPSGVPGRAWATACAVIGGHLKRLFDDCLRGGVFPQPWRRAKLVLLRKEGKPADSPSGYRPICLLDEEAKLFERIIAGRLVQHLEEVGPGLHEHQYGFRRSRSTVDAILRVRALVEAAVQEGRVVVCVSLDITNAFNTLPWDRIGGGAETPRRSPVP